MPSDRASGLLLWGRAATLATVVMLVGGVSHVSAGGLLPGAGWLAGMTVFSAVLCARFLLTAIGPLRLVAVVVTGQAMVHLGLSAFAGHRGPPAGTAGHAVDHQHAPGEGVGALHALQHATDPTTLTSDAHPSAGSAALSHLVEHMADTSLLMLLAHLAAAVAVGLWLAVGESALWTVLALTSTSVRALVASARRALGQWLLPPPAPLAPALALAGASSAGFGPRRRLDGCVTSPRGPPRQLEI